MPEPSHSPGVRLAELVAALSLGIDLGFGQPMEHVLRQARIALRLAERVGLGDEERATVYYTALLVNVGCHTDAHEQARWFGDDIAMKAMKYEYPPRSLSGAVAMMRLLGSGEAPIRRARTWVEFAVGGLAEINGMIESHARLAGQFAERLGLPQTVRDALSEAYEYWDGHGWPGAASGDSIPPASRIALLAEYVEVAHRTGGLRDAVELAEERSAKMFDPALVACFAADPGAIFDGLEDLGNWNALIDAEPALTLRLDREQFDRALLAIADFVDLKSVYTVGHSRAVSELVAAAAREASLSSDDVELLRRTGLVHDLGRLGVSNGIWEKPGPLTVGEWERARMAPYFTGRMLQQSDALAKMGTVAVAHRERMDGSGYPRGLPGSSIPFSARLLGAADAYQAMRERRAHREPLDPSEAADELRGAVRLGHLDGEAVDAVLAAGGHRRRRRREGPAGLTAREVEVLLLVARGLSNKQVAERLVISPKTAGNHIEHIYTKLGVSNRAQASLFAVQHGLLPADEDDLRA